MKSANQSHSISHRVAFQLVSLFKLKGPLIFCNWYKIVVITVAVNLKSHQLKLKGTSCIYSSTNVGCKENLLPQKTDSGKCHGLQFTNMPEQTSIHNKRFLVKQRVGKENMEKSCPVSDGLLLTIVTYPYQM